MKKSTVNALRRVVREWDKTGKWDFYIVPTERWDDDADEYEQSILGWAASLPDGLFMAAAPADDSGVITFEPESYREHLVISAAAGAYELGSDMRELLEAETFEP